MHIFLAVERDLMVTWLYQNVTPDYGEIETEHFQNSVSDSG